MGVSSTTDAKWEWGNELTFVHVDKHHIQTDENMGRYTVQMLEASGIYPIQGKYLKYYLSV